MEGVGKGARTLLSAVIALIHADRSVRAPGRRQLRQPPIHYQHLTELPDHDIVGLQVAVQHAPAMGEGDGVANLAENEEKPLQRIFAEGSGIFFPQILEDGSE